MLVMMLNAIVSWMPAVLMRSFGVDAKTAGVTFGPTFLVAGIVGTLTARYIISRSDKNTVQRIFRSMRVCVWIAVPAAVLRPLAPTMTVALALVAVAQSAMNVLKLARLDKVFPIHASLDDVV